MKNKNLIAITLVLILGSIAVWLVFNSKKSTIKKELSDFAVVDTHLIDKIHLIDKAGKEITLEKNEDGKTWKLNGKYTARFDGVKQLMNTIRLIKVRNPVGKRAMENVIKQLATGSTKCEIYIKGKLAKAYYIGGETQDQGGTYMLLQDVKTGENSSVPFVMFIPGFQGFVSVYYFTSEKDWRDRSLFRSTINDIKSVELTYAKNAEGSFKLNVINNQTFDITTGTGKKIEKYDTLAVRQYLSYYSNISFEGIESQLKQQFKDSILNNGWVHQIKLTNTNGETTTLQSYLKPPKRDEYLDDKGQPLKEDRDRMFAVVNENKKEIVLIQYYSFGKLYVPATYFLKKK
jgi:hypothetical protein